MAVAVAASIGLAACTTDADAGATSTARATPTTTTTAEAERDVLVGGHHFKARCAGSGPSIVVVADYGRTMDDMWGDIAGVLAAKGRVCAYDRLGIGRSDAVPERQTFETMADDLDGLITTLGLTRPVVVVAHAMGGPVALTWAGDHAPDARALMLLDPVPPGFLGPEGALVKALPARDAGDLELGNLWSDVDRLHDPATNKESLDPASWAAYEHLPAVDVPLYNLLEDMPQPWPAVVDAKKVNATWRDLQGRVLTMSSRSEQLSVPTQDAWPKVMQSTLGRALQS